MVIEYSAFITAKNGTNITDCEDSFSINVQKGNIEQKARFAIADGVSRSLMPFVWANLLTSSFTEGKRLFVKTEKQVLFDRSSDIFNLFRTQYANIYNRSDENEKFALDLRAKKTPFAASTFVGLNIEKDCAIITCIGDSIAYMFKSVNSSCELFSSMAKDGKMQFGNNPEYVTSEGNTYGDVLQLPLDFENGFIFLMTDALSDWFNSLSGDERCSAVKKLDSLQSHSSFIEFVNGLRSTNRLKDDDTTLLILHIDDSETPDLKFVEKHIDCFSDLKLVTTSPSMSLKPFHSNNLCNANEGEMDNNEELSLDYEEQSSDDTNINEDYNKNNFEC